MNRRKVCAAALVLALAVLLGGAAAAQETMSLTDDLGRSVTIEKQPQRVAALIGSFADIWCLAGGGETRIAAADCGGLLQRQDADRGQSALEAWAARCVTPAGRSDLREKAAHTASIREGREIL